MFSYLKIWDETFLPSARKSGFPRQLFDAATVVGDVPVPAGRGRQSAALYVYIVVLLWPSAETCGGDVICSVQCGAVGC